MSHNNKGLTERSKALNAHHGLEGVEPDNFYNCIEQVLHHEGGFVNDPLDPGRATNRGITIGTLTKWRGQEVSDEEVRNLSLKETIEIYKAWYWIPSIRAIADTSIKIIAGLDLCVFDTCVNSGLKRATNMLHNIDIEASPKSRIDAYCDARVTFYKGLTLFYKYGKGWLRRAESIRTEAKSLFQKRLQ